MAVTPNNTSMATKLKLCPQLLLQDHKFSRKTVLFSTNRIMHCSDKVNSQSSTPQKVAILKICLRAIVGRRYLRQSFFLIKFETISILWRLTSPINHPLWGPLLKAKKKKRKQPISLAIKEIIFNYQQRSRSRRLPRKWILCRPPSSTNPSQPTPTCPLTARI